jgi:adenylosuccinate lyase
MPEVDLPNKFDSTLPKDPGINVIADSKYLVGGRYGTKEMIAIWGAEPTFQRSLYAQSIAVQTMSDLHSDIAPYSYASEIAEKAKLGIISPDRIREIEDKTGHDIIAINTSLEEQVSSEAAALINLARTSADTTETAKALQVKESIEVTVDSLENLRDVVLEKAYRWKEIPYMDQTHGLDAVPGCAGGILAHYAEMLQSNLDFWNHVYRNSVKGKWADVTGRHHSAKALDIDGIKLEEEYCKELGLGHMIAPLQVPAREFLADVVHVGARTAETMNNIACYMAWGKSSDVDLFIDKGKKRKGSSGMPHKDIKGGNPTTEEQTESFTNYMRGAMTTMLSACAMRPSRDLSGSASDRITLEISFKWGDYVIRRLASAVYNLGINEGRSLERVNRSYGVTTSERVLTYLTDRRRTKNSMPRSKAHDLVAELATEAYTGRKPFVGVLLQSNEITSRLSESDIREAADPLTYLGESKKIVELVYDSFHGKKTLT